MQSIHEPEDTLTECGYRPLMTGRLTKAGYATWGDIRRADYQELIKVHGVGAGMIAQLIDDLHKEGRRMKNTEHLPDVLTERMKAIKSEKEGILDSRTSHAPGKPAKSSKATPTQPSYIEIIVQRGYHCRSCSSVTIVGENERPKGIEFAGLKWSNAIQGNSVEPYFVCLECANSIEIVGKLVVDLVSESAL
jgi:hypothetical protein